MSDFIFSRKPLNNLNGGQFSYYQGIKQAASQVEQKIKGSSDRAEALAITLGVGDVNLMETLIDTTNTIFCKENLNTNIQKIIAVLDSGNKDGQLDINDAPTFKKLTMMNQETLNKVFTDSEISLVKGTSNTEKTVVDFYQPQFGKRPNSRIKELIATSEAQQLPEEGAVNASTLSLMKPSYKDNPKASLEALTLKENPVEPIKESYYPLPFKGSFSPFSASVLSQAIDIDGRPGKTSQDERKNLLSYLDIDHDRKITQEEIGERDWEIQNLYTKIQSRNTSLDDAQVKELTVNELKRTFKTYQRENDRLTRNSGAVGFSKTYKYKELLRRLGKSDDNSGDALNSVTFTIGEKGLFLARGARALKGSFPEIFPENFNEMDIARAIGATQDKPIPNINKIPLGLEVTIDVDKIVKLLQDEGKLTKPGKQLS